MRKTLCAIITAVSCLALSAALTGCGNEIPISPGTYVLTDPGIFPAELRRATLTIAPGKTEAVMALRVEDNGGNGSDAGMADATEMDTDRLDVGGDVLGDTGDAGAGDTGAGDTGPGDAGGSNGDGPSGPSATLELAIRPKSNWASGCDGLFSSSSLETFDIEPDPFVIGGIGLQNARLTAACNGSGLDLRADPDVDAGDFNRRYRFSRSR